MTHEEKLAWAQGVVHRDSGGIRGRGLGQVSEISAEASEPDFAGVRQREGVRPLHGQASCVEAHDRYRKGGAQLTGPPGRVNYQRPDADKRWGRTR
jgi:hypothetical protein